MMAQAAVIADEGKRMSFEGFDLSLSVSIAGLAALQWEWRWAELIQSRTKAKEKLFEMFPQPETLGWLWHNAVFDL